MIPKYSINQTEKVIIDNNRQLSGRKVKTKINCMVIKP